MAAVCVWDAEIGVFLSLWSSDVSTCVLECMVYFLRVFERESRMGRLRGKYTYRLGR